MSNFFLAIRINTLNNTHLAKGNMEPQAVKYSVKIIIAELSP